MNGIEIGHIVELWRYPVKSMRGEMLNTLEIDGRGVVGDRLFALRTADGKLGSGKTSRRFQQVDGLFRFHAWYEGETPVIRLPSGALLRGEALTVDEALSAALGLEVSLAREGAVSHFDSSAIHLLTTASLRWLRDREPAARIDSRRFRPNIVLEADGNGLLEDSWVGRTIQLGDAAILRITKRTERCVMPNFAQDDLPADGSILRALADGNEACLGVYTAVLQVGSVRQGDRAYLV